MAIQKSMEAEVTEVKRIENEYRKVVTNKGTMAEKLSENEMVLAEFNMLKEDAGVYKLVGPILAKQELSESKSNVTKRIDFIKKEVARLETMETAFQAKIAEKTAALKKMQDDMQRVVMAAQKAQQEAAAQAQVAQ